MIAKIIHWSIKNRILVLMMTIAIVAYGIFSLQKTPKKNPQKTLKIV